MTNCGKILENSTAMAKESITRSEGERFTVQPGLNNISFAFAHYKPKNYFVVISRLVSGSLSIDSTHAKGSNVQSDYLFRYNAKQANLTKLSSSSLNWRLMVRGTFKTFTYSTSWEADPNGSSVASNIKPFPLTAAFLMFAVWFACLVV